MLLVTFCALVLSWVVAVALSDNPGRTAIQGASWAVIGGAITATAWWRHRQGRPWDAAGSKTVNPYRRFAVSLGVPIGVIALGVTAVAIMNPEDVGLALPLVGVAIFLGLVALALRRM